MRRHVTRMKITEDEATLLLRLVYHALDTRLMEERRKELLILMDKLEYESLYRLLDQPLR
jgi:hypothetical protein